MSTHSSFVCSRAFFLLCSGHVESHHTEFRDTLLLRRVCCAGLRAMPVQHLEAPEQAQEDIPSSKNVDEGWFRAKNVCFQLFVENVWYMFCYGSGFFSKKK